MKTYISFLFVLFFNFHTAQISNEMNLAGKKIEYKGMLINLGEAEEYATFQSTEAYNAFSKAKKIKNWNIFWSVLGGWEIGAGLINVINGYGIGFLDLGIGGALVAMVASRESKQRMWTKQGIEAFNKSLQPEARPQEQIQYQQTQQASQLQNPENQKSRTDRLLDLKKLLDAGVLTQEEFDSEKKKILNE